MLRTFIFSIGLILPAPAAWADAAADCAQIQDPDRSIRGCTDIIDKGHGTRRALAAAYNNRSNAYNSKGDHDRAGKAAQGLPDAERSLELRPNDARTLDTRGNIFEALGRRDEAIADFRRALANDPLQQESENALKRLGASP